MYVCMYARTPLRPKIQLCGDRPADRKCARGRDKILKSEKIKKLGRFEILMLDWGGASMMMMMMLMLMMMMKKFQHPNFKST